MLLQAKKFEVFHGFPALNCLLFHPFVQSCYRLKIATFIKCHNWSCSNVPQGVEFLALVSSVRTVHACISFGSKALLETRRTLTLRFVFKAILQLEVILSTYRAVSVFDAVLLEIFRSLKWPKGVTAETTSQNDLCCGLLNFIRLKPSLVPFKSRKVFFELVCFEWH